MHPNWRFSQLPGCFMHRLKFEMYWSMTKQSKWEKLSSKENQVPHQRGSYTSKGQAARHSRPLLMFRTTSPVLKCFSLSGETGSLLCCAAPSAPYFFNKATKREDLGKFREFSSNSQVCRKEETPVSSLSLFSVRFSLSSSMQCNWVEWQENPHCQCKPKGR